MTDLLRTVIDFIHCQKRKTVPVDHLLELVRQEHESSFTTGDRLVGILEELVKRDVIKPFGKKRHPQLKNLPLKIVARENDRERENRKKKAECKRILETTPNWRGWLYDIAQGLTDPKSLTLVSRVNEYIQNRDPRAPSIPARERSLQLFGHEKTIDRNPGLFGKKIPLSAIDCFHVPEPIPFAPLELLPTASRPLIIIENTNTYDSLCKANRIAREFAAVVYGKGFKVTHPASACEALSGIEHQVKASGILYFGDLDPEGLDIPKKISEHRSAAGLSPVRAETRLYRALLDADLPNPHEGTRRPDPDWTTRFLGQELASRYLERAHEMRFPQEGIGTARMLEALRPSAP